MNGGSNLPSVSNIEDIMANVTTVLATLKDMEEKYKNTDAKVSMGCY